MGISASYLTPRTPPNVIWAAFEATLPDLAGKVVAVTGCTSGTGRQLALTAAAKGATVVALNRPSERADALLAELRAIVPECEAIECDLASFESTHSAAAALVERFADGGLDTLCLNAGVMACEDIATGDGFDVQIQTNHLSHFLLASETMSLLETAAQKRGEARIVLHSSVARRGPPLDAAFFAANSGGSLGGNGNSMLFNGGRWVRYHQSKLANVLFAQDLHARLNAKGSRVKALCAAPGYCATPLQVKAVASGGMGKSTIWTTKFAHSIPDGTCPLLACCFAESAASGEFYEPSLKMNCVGPVGSSPVPMKERDPVSMAQLWEASEAAIGAKWDL